MKNDIVSIVSARSQLLMTIKLVRTRICAFVPYTQFYLHNNDIVLYLVCCLTQLRIVHLHIKRSFAFIYKTIYL